MKTIVKLLPLTLLIGLFFTACQTDKDDNLNNDEQVAQQMTISSEDHAKSEDLFDDVEFQVEDAIEKSGGGSGCPTVTADPNWLTYPRTITIDFGDSCLGPDGRTRAGKIVVEVSDNILNTGASRTAALVGFSVDGIQVEGSRTWKNLGYDGDGNITLSRTVVGGRITYLNGDVAEWESDLLVKQTAGADTPFILADNVCEIIGTANGVNREGMPFTVEINDPLVKKWDCQWVVGGSIELTADNVTVLLDYGDGNCDNKAILTLPNGTEVEIMI